jgi:hypothetical protein
MTLITNNSNVPIDSILAPHICGKRPTEKWMVIDIHVPTSMLCN